MGIVGLLPLLKDVIKKVPLENFTGQCIAVDAYSWLHKGIRSVALGLFQDEDRNEYLEYVHNHTFMTVNNQLVSWWHHA